MKKMTKQEKSWILYDVANSAFTLIIVTTFMPLFFKGVASKGIDSALSTANLGFANSAASLILALMSPVLGAIADNKGIKKKFVFLFLMTGIVFTSMFTLVGEGDWVLCIVLYVIASVGYMGANVFYDAFLNDVTTHDRADWISSNGYAWGYIGSVIPFILCLVIYLKPGLFGIGSNITAIRAVFIITALWWLICSIPLLLNVTQIHGIEGAKNPVRESFARLISTFKDIKKYRNVFLFMLAYFFYIDGVYTIIKMAIAYGMEMGLSQSSLLIIVLAIQIIAFPCALVFGRLAQKFSARRMLFAGIGVYFIIAILGFSMAYITDMKVKLAILWAMALLVGMAQGGIQALSRSFFCKIIPKEKSAQFFGFFDIFGKFATVLGPLLMGIAAAVTGSSSYGVLALVILFAVGGGLLMRVKDQSAD
ncbi:MAG: MFS transporter [Spirochaetota bacterium]